MNLSLHNVPTKLSGSKIQEAATFYAAMLMSKDLIDALSVRVVFVDTLIAEVGHEGSTLWEDDYKKPREFTISLDGKMGERKTLITLAHEFVHVKQYAMGELADTTKFERCRWRGKLVDITKVDYWDFPWEIEAHGREMGLYVRFRDRKVYKSAQGTCEAQSNREGASDTSVPEANRAVQEGVFA